MGAGNWSPKIRGALQADPSRRRDRIAVLVCVHEPKKGCVPWHVAPKRCGMPSSNHTKGARPGRLNLNGMAIIRRGMSTGFR